jgi:hypothetical protein
VASWLCTGESALLIWYGEPWSGLDVAVTPLGEIPVWVAPLDGAALICGAWHHYSNSESFVGQSLTGVVKP